MKRVGESDSSIAATDNMELGSPSSHIIERDARTPPEAGHPPSYRDTLQRNNPNITFETRDNPIWVADEQEYLLEDDELEEDEDPLCPTILLTAAEKKVLREPWRNALIIRMFNKGIGYLQLKRRLKTKMGLEGRFLPD